MAVAGGEVEVLPAVEATAVSQTKDRATELWDEVVAAAGGVARGDRRRSAGVGSVWLDGVRHPVLDRSVARVGAPQAWEAGFTGAGVPVAVLDSGIDVTHPDLAGRVAEARNFTAEPGTDDLAGHGTHVASTVGGSGAASGGSRRGVAPGAALLVGKVCDGGGACYESDILAGIPEVGPEHAIQVSNEEGWNVQPTQWELAVGVTNPFMGVPMYAETTLGWGPGWTDFQISGFYGPGVGKKVEATVRESPRTPGLVAESKAAVTYGIGKAEAGFQSDFQGEVPGNVKVSLGPVSETGSFEVAPDPDWHGWDRTSAAKPSTPTTGLGFSAAVGSRYSSEVVNFADGIIGLANDIANVFSGPSTPPAAPAPAPTPAPAPSSRP